MDTAPVPILINVLCSLPNWLCSVPVRESTMTFSFTVSFSKCYFPWIICQMLLEFDRFQLRFWAFQIFVSTSLHKGLRNNFTCSNVLNWYFQSINYDYFGLDSFFLMFHDPMFYILLYILVIISSPNLTLCFHATIILIRWFWALGHIVLAQLILLHVVVPNTVSVADSRSIYICTLDIELSFVITELRGTHKTKN